MNKIGLVTCAALPALPPDERLLLPLYKEAGLSTDIVIWDDPSVNWHSYDALILRSPWDYTQKYPAFLRWLEQTRPVPLWNPRHLIQPNLDKRYLLNLEEQGFNVCETWICDTGEAPNLEAWYQRLGPFVVKPTVSASGMDTHCFTQPPTAEQQSQIAALSAQKALMVQPFYEEIRHTGEWSFCYMGGAFSHLVLKTPPANGFLIHEEHGGTTTARVAPAHLLEQIQPLIESLPTPWLYARVDGLVEDGQFMLMELELTEPSLYLNHDAQAPQRFVEALLRL